MLDDYLGAGFGFDLVEDYLPDDQRVARGISTLCVDQLVNAPRRGRKIFTEREGGVEHVGADNMSFGRDYIADRFAESLGTHTA